MDQIPAHLLPLLLALVSGVLMAVQGSLNTAMAKVVGLWEATFVVHITGTLLLLVILFVVKAGKGGLGALMQAPWYAYLGGVAGVFIIYLVAASIPLTGVANATTAIIVGQVLTAVLIDHFGAFGLTRTPCGINQLAGLVLLAVGAKLLLR